MKTLIVILVLFSSSVFADVFNCDITQQELNYGKEKYQIVVDTGDEELSVITLGEAETGNFKNLITEVWGIGKIIFLEGNPYKNKTFSSNFYITKIGTESYYGVFFHDSFPKTITLELVEDPDKIIITDSESMFGHLQVGTCK